MLRRRPISTCPRPLTYIDPVFIGIQTATRGAVAFLGVVKLDSSQKPKAGTMYYQQRLGYITLGALFRQIRRGDNIQNSRNGERWLGSSMGKQSKMQER